MAQFTVRYLTMRPGRAGELPRYFWQPSSKLRADGWRMERVPLDHASYADARALEQAAIARANELNDALDVARLGAARAAVAPVLPRGARTLGELIANFRGSEAFDQVAGNRVVKPGRLRPKTQASYRQCLDKLEVWGGDAPVRAIDEPRVQKLKKGLSATPAYANAVVRVLRLLLEYGRREGWVTRNAALRPGLLEVDPSSLIWPREAVDVFVAAADAMGHYSLGTAVLLNEWLGQRQGDVIRMPRAALRLGGGTLLVRQSKGGRGKAGVALPLGAVSRLADRLASQLAMHAAREAAGAPAIATIIYSEATGLPYRPDHFRHVFAAVRARAAEAHPAFDVDHLLPGRDMADADAFVVRMMDLTFMALRHTAITRLGEAECEPTLIASISGHALGTVTQILERYMVRTSKMARLAFQRRAEAELPLASTIAGASG